MKIQLNPRFAIEGVRLVFSNQQYLLQLTDGVPPKSQLIKLGNLFGLEVGVSNLTMDAVSQIIVSDLLNALGIRQVFQVGCTRRSIKSPKQVFTLSVVSSATPFIVLADKHNMIAGLMRFSFSTKPLPFIADSSIVAITYLYIKSDEACCFLLNYMMENVVDQPVDKLLLMFPGIRLFSQFPAVALRLVENKALFPDIWGSRVFFLFDNCPTVMGTTRIIACETKRKIKYIINKQYVLLLLLIARRKRTKFLSPDVWGLILDEFIKPF
jgi:hypothetical protein